MTSEAYLREIGIINKQFYEAQLKAHDVRYNNLAQLLEKATGSVRLAPDKSAETEVVE
jgi:hypothetical protein